MSTIGTILGKKKYSSTVIYAKETPLDKHIESVLEFPPSQLVLKVKSPILSTHTSYGLPIQIQLDGHFDEAPLLDTPVFIIPLIPQYFHNFFETFSNILALIDLKESFKVLIVYYEHDLNNGIFKSLTEDPLRHINAKHVLDFLTFLNIPFECILDTEVSTLRVSHCYLFFSEFHIQGLDDPIIKHNNKDYYLYHFLKVPDNSISIKTISKLRELIPHEGASPNKKIYLSRKKTIDRPFPFEDALEARLIELGFTSIFFEDMSFSEQVRAVRSADYIVALYGSALVNCGFAKPSAKVFSINYTDKYRVDLYEVIFSNFDIDFTIFGAYAKTLDLDELCFIIERWSLGSNESSTGLVY